MVPLDLMLQLHLFTPEKVDVMFRDPGSSCATYLPGAALNLICLARFEPTILSYFNVWKSTNCGLGDRHES